MSLQQLIVPVLQKYGVKKAALFGSYARGDFDETSDVDLIIEPPRGMGLEFIGLKHELEDTLQKRIDFITYNSVDKYLKPYIFEHLRPIL